MAQGGYEIFWLLHGEGLFRLRNLRKGFQRKRHSKKASLRRLVKDKPRKFYDIIEIFK
jgi:hypothetical protein